MPKPLTEQDCIEYRDYQIQLLSFHMMVMSTSTPENMVKNYIKLF